MAPRPDEHWDFYFARVDGAPASIWLDLALRERIPVDGRDTLYAIAADMLAPGDHGMGEQSEADAMWPIEDRIVAAAGAIGLDYIGRLRNSGVWQLTFMGAAGAEPELDHIAHATLAAGEGGARDHQVLSKPDADWSYYREFLFPSRERLQWIGDRNVVAQLIEAGDPLTTPRDVRHWVWFDTAADRDGFAAAVAADGFACDCSTTDDSGRYAAIAVRRDPVGLEAIHAVVMRLVEHGDAWRGDYDGWETTVESSAD